MIDGLSFAGSLREGIRNALPREAFLHISRCKGLFATDAPRSDEGQRSLARLMQEGHVVVTERGIAYISPGPKVLRSWEDQCPTAPDLFAATLIRFAGQEPGAEACEIFSLGLRWLLLPENGSARRYDKLVRQTAAKLMRTGPCGGLYGCALLRFALLEAHSADRTS